MAETKQEVSVAVPVSEVLSENPHPATAAAAVESPAVSNTLEQAAIQPPAVDIKALQKSYSELQSAFTKKAQAYKELEQKVNSMPSREEIIREYLLNNATDDKPAVLTSSSSAFDFAKEKKPTSLAQANHLAREYFKKGV